MVILNAWVEDNYDDYLFLIEYQSVGKNVDPADVDWILYCEDKGFLLSLGTCIGFRDRVLFGRGITDLF